jgi:hypothetical protein
MPDIATDYRDGARGVLLVGFERGEAAPPHGDRPSGADGDGMGTRPPDPAGGAAKSLIE